jgi:hypothetical protein
MEIGAARAISRPTSESGPARLDESPPEAGALPLRKRKALLAPAAGPSGQALIPGGALPGHVYFRAPEWKEGSGRSRDEAYEAQEAIDLNCEVSFRDSADMIECRHLALAVGQARSDYLQQKKSGTPVGRFSYSAFASAETLQAAASSQLETLFSALLERPPSHHLLRLDQWGEFLHDQFKGIQPGEHRHALLTSIRHVMLLELQVKQKEGAPSYRVVTFYDPNQTATHQRVVLDDATTRTSRISDFLPEDELAHYFPATDSQPVARVIDLTPDLLRTPASALEVLAKGDTKRAHLQISHAADRCSVAELQLRVMYNLAEGLSDRLALSLKDCKANAAFTLLQACDDDARPALYLALAQGHPHVVQALVEKILDPTVNLSSAQRLELLLARDQSGDPGLLMAFTHHHSEAARVLVEAVLDAKSGLRREDLSAFLVARAGAVDEAALTPLGQSDPALTLRQLLEASGSKDSW